MGGRPSGPEAALIFSFLRIWKVISGVISISEMPLFILSILEGNSGVMPLSNVNIDVCGGNTVIILCSP